MPLALGLSGVQVAHAAFARRGGWRSLALQVRLVFFGLLVLGTLPGLWPLHPMQFAGVNALLVFDYCVLARLLTLLPWNRPAPFSWALVGRLLLTPPAPGPIAARRLMAAAGCAGTTSAQTACLVPSASGINGPLKHRPPRRVA